MLNFPLPEKRQAYWQLMRIDKPIGIYLLLWPTLWALWFAAEGIPDLTLLIIFSLGVFVMRSAGCVINDYADRHVDGAVERTKNRPFAKKIVSEKEGLSLFGLLIVLAFALVLFLNWQTIVLSIGALILAALYPFMKRFTYLPQFVLGAAFSWAIPMAYMATQMELPPILWLLYLANLLWTVAYDTLYAMVDRDDDLKVGIKSTAILFGRYDRALVLIFQIGALICLGLVGIEYDRQAFFYCSLCLALLVFIYHFWLTRDKTKPACFKAFLQNHYAGLIILLGIIADYLV